MCHSDLARTIPGILLRLRPAVSHVVLACPVDLAQLFKSRIQVLEQQRHVLLSFYQERKAVVHLGAVHVLVDQHAVDAVRIQEVGFLRPKQILGPQLDPKVLYNDDRFCSIRGNVSAQLCCAPILLMLTFLHAVLHDQNHGKESDDAKELYKDPIALHQKMMDRDSMTVR